MRDFSKTIRVKNSMKGIDGVHLDVPLFIRLLEFANASTYVVRKKKK